MKPLISIVVLSLLSLGCSTRNGTNCTTDNTVAVERMKGERESQANKLAYDTKMMELQGKVVDNCVKNGNVPQWVGGNVVCQVLPPRPAK